MEINKKHLEKINELLKFEKTEVIKTINGANHVTLTLRLKKIEGNDNQVTFGLDVPDDYQFNIILRSILLGIKLAQNGEKEFLPRLVKIMRNE